jgi:hypothetical protein
VKSPLGFRMISGVGPNFWCRERSDVKKEDRLSIETVVQVNYKGLSWGES